MVSTIITLMLFISSVISFKMQDPFSDLKRDLSAWSTYSGTDCGLCSAESACTIYDGNCASFDETSLTSLTFIQSTEYSYCSGVEPNGYIDLSKMTDSKLTLTHQNGAAVGSHDLCVWKIVPQKDIELAIDITRDMNIYEDMRIEISTKSGVKTYTAKDLANCDGTTGKIRITDAYFLKVKIQILSNSYNYSITVSQEKSEDLYIPDWVVLLLCLITLVFTLVLWGVLIYCCYKKLKEDRKRNIHTEAYKNKLLSKMKQGTFSDMKINFGQDSWVIWLEAFEGDNKVHIVNQCDHVFHSDCIKQWFQNIKHGVKIQCPHWWTEITTNKTKKSKIIPRRESEESREVPPTPITRNEDAQAVSIRLE